MEYTKKLKNLNVIVKDSGVKPIGQICTVKEAVPIIRAIFRDLPPDQEHLIVLFLDNRNNVTGFKCLFSGGQDSSVVDFRVLFRNALLFGATSIIISHNHPVGDSTPSDADRFITTSLIKTGNLLHIPVVDHIIITNNNKTDYFSFKQAKMMK